MRTMRPFSITMAALAIAGLPVPSISVKFFSTLIFGEGGQDKSNASRASVYSCASIAVPDPIPG